MSIEKFGDCNSIESSINIGSPKSLDTKTGSIISSTTLNESFSFILGGKGFKVLNNISCLTGPLFNKILIEGTKTLLPKLSVNSLKYVEVSSSDIKLPTAGSNIAFEDKEDIAFISLLSEEISCIIKGS